MLNEKKNENLILKNIVASARVSSGVRIENVDVLWETWLAR
jgi:hypothetical protein